MSNTSGREMVLVGGTEGRPRKDSFIQIISGMAECNMITMNYWTIFLCNSVCLLDSYQAHRQDFENGINEGQLIKLHPPL